MAACVVLALLTGCGGKPADSGQQQAARREPTGATGRGGGAKARASAPDRRAAEPDPATDPCAVRLHELCGPLLHYYAKNYRLPDRLEDVDGTFPGVDVASMLTCPESGEPYAYEPEGLPFTDRPEPRLVIIHDSAPAHAGYRWAVVAQEPRGRDPLILRVLPVPEGWFATPAARKLPERGPLPRE